MTSLTIDLSEDVTKVLKKRAEKNLLSLKEQVEDIVRRSMLSYKNKGPSIDSKIDDSLIPLFSRKKTGKKKK